MGGCWFFTYFMDTMCLTVEFCSINQSFNILLICRWFILGKLCSEKATVT